MGSVLRSATEAEILLWGRTWALSTQALSPIHHTLGFFDVFEAEMGSKLFKHLQKSPHPQGFAAWDPNSSWSHCSGVCGWGLVRR